MADLAPLKPDDMVMPLLLVKAVLAILAVVLFLYYRFYWERAKKHLAIHFFFTKWRAVKHAFILGFAAIGFAIGFSLELFGQQIGLGATAARFVSSIFEVGSLFCMLYVFFALSLEDVPHFQHIAENAKLRHHAHMAQEAQAQPAAKQRKKSASNPKKRR
jgi:hypothetical protein